MRLAKTVFASMVVAICSAGASRAWAQVPAGAEFQVNTYTTLGQLLPAVGRDAQGNFVVVWEDQGDYIIKGQRYDRAGSRVGAPFHVSGQHSHSPALAMGPRGDFVVVWAHYTDGYGRGILGRRFDAAGNPAGAEFQVNTYTTGEQLYPNVVFDGQRNFVVAWHSFPEIVPTPDVRGQRFDAQGNRRGAEFQVNTYTTGSQFLSDISSDAAGNFVVAWIDLQGLDGSGASVHAQRYDTGGTALGGNFTANSYTTGNQWFIAIAHAPDGSFVAAFTDRTMLSAKRYSAAGSPLGGEFQVNSTTTMTPYFPDVAMDSAGNFVVSWTDSNTGEGDVRARRFRADGTPRGADFRVNTYTTGLQQTNAAATQIAADPAGNFVLGWYSHLQDGDWFGVFAQRYGGIHPNALAVDTTLHDPAANGVWEPGETVDVRPSWFNANGAAQTVGGILAGITGPAGASYAIGDGTASYGTIPNGAAGSCEDCYLVSVDDPPVRPVLHWDASAVEMLTPDSLGQAMRRRLHIGESFADVPPTHPYYRFVETVLHHSITQGCGGGAFCPSSFTTREQMSVFVLVAKEGSGYSPPACTKPVFGDVPASSPFCRWIEELARRGVTGGCGGGNYCPTAAVSREQMAAFVLRTLDPALNPPACTTPVFNDVPASSPFCLWIEELARRGIVAGCGGGKYCPTDAVTREQMAVFLTLTFGLTLYGP